jgi:beta-galactosidase
MPESTPNTAPTAGRLHLGAAYYPEHWPEERWPEDIRLMKEASFSVVRMAEFAWSTLEPAEGEFHFEWLDRAIQMLADSGIVSVLGTPTATPPAWLTAAYPDIFAVDEHGRRVQHGNRCHYCPTSPDMLNASHRIVQAMAERYGPNPYVIGWQIDNEFGRVCYCDRCRALFQKFLTERYVTLDNLNQHWSTAYWSQTYSNWEQIPIPLGGHNPGLMLEWKRFVTFNNRQFQKVQLDILRPHLLPGVWITHNFMGWFDGLDHYTMSEDLDMASWDYYVGTGHHDHLSHGAIHDLTRGFKCRNFWVMETQPGCVNWASVNNMLNKWEARTMAWQGVAHGADGILYWQWRSALNGQEQYHGTLVDQAGQPRPFYEEVKHLGQEFAAISSLVVGSAPRAKVAILNSYESRWSIQWQPHHRDFDYVQHFNHYYRPVAKRNVPIDVLGAGTLIDAKQLAGYKLIIAPALIMPDDNLVKVLKAFVHRGGHLVLTIRSGMKDSYNALLPVRQPGPLAELAGVVVEDYYALAEPVVVKGSLFDGTSQIWAERLKPYGNATTSVIARYGRSNGWLDEQIAVTVCAYGMGLVYFVGAYLDDAAQQALLDRFLATASLKGLLDSQTNPFFAPTPAPDGVEVSARTNPAGEEIYFVINHTLEPKTFALPWPVHEHLTGQNVQTELRLLPYGVAILTQIR